MQVLPNLAALHASCWAGLSLRQEKSKGRVVDGIEHPKVDDPWTVPQVVPGQQAATELPPHTP